MPLPLLIAAVPVVVASTDLIIGIVIGVIGGGASTLSLVGIYSWLFPSNATTLDELTTPIALIIEKLNAALARIPEYNLAQQRFFNISNEELKKVLDIEQSSDNLTDNIIDKMEAILKTKAMLEMLHTFIQESDINTTMVGLGELLTDEHQQVLREMQGLIEQNQELRDEVQRNQTVIERLLRIVDEQLTVHTDDINNTVQRVLP